LDFCNYLNIPLFFLSCYLGVGLVVAELPPDLPGEEVSDQFLRSVIPVDTTKPVVEKAKPALEWYDKAAKTWEAAPLSEQMSKDRTTVPMGKGGIFVPRLTELHKEPDIEIVDSVGRTIASGEPGVTYSLEPGKYSVMIGSGNHRQRIVRQIDVQEFKTIPILPDWSGLIIETIDTTSTTFKGEYEIVRIDEFEPLGRGYGAEVALGESVKAWILKPGIYKIFGRGESYNTLKNFVTVRLLPGELSKLVLIERTDDLAIMGGGTIEVDAGRKIASNWKYGGNLGGNMQFINNIDNKLGKKSTNKDFSTFMSLNSSLWLRYLNNPFEWETTLWLKEGFNLNRQTSAYSTQKALDEFKGTTLFIWRFYKWLGPYGSAEVNTNLLPKNLTRGNKDYFLVLNDNNSVDTSKKSVQTSFRLNPSFCPLSVEFGAGVNVDALNLNFLDITVRLGGGSNYSNYPDKFTELLDKNELKQPYDSLLVSKSVLLRSEEKTEVFEFGPIGVISGNVRIGRFGSAGAEVKIFAPLFPENRFLNPDFDLDAIISWRITRAVTLDYEFDYQLKQTLDTKAEKDLATNSVVLRFSYTSR
jgi:hypothetical protein